MATSEFELHPSRLATTDETGKRIFIFPADVDGRFRRMRTRIHFGLILFFLLLPWLKINGKQALLLDIVQRRFEFFGLSLRAHNVPLLFLVLSTLAFALFGITTLYGRVWCGWACPQTVFIDGVFRRIERWAEGAALERRRLEKAPWNGEKIRKRMLKWSLYGLTSFVVTHSFFAYFVGTDRLYEMMTHSPTKNAPSFLFMIALNAIVLFDFVWFREQFCTIVCPYGRFQSVLMDKGSLAVTYDANRGEPRATPQAKQLSKVHGSGLGDCVNCYRCVQVCPTGIDIRRGLQMECIACSGCIDACDAVMTKLGKAPGLIKYSSRTTVNNERRRLNYRALIYLAISLTSLGFLTGAIANIEPVSVQLLKAKGEPYSTAQIDGEATVVNHLKIEVSNQSGVNTLMDVELKDSSSGAEIIIARRPVAVANGELQHVDMFVRFPKRLLISGATKQVVVVRLKSEVSGVVTTLEREASLVGPF